MLERTRYSWKPRKGTPAGGGDGSLKRREHGRGCGEVRTD